MTIGSWLNGILGDDSSTPSADGVPGTPAVTPQVTTGAPPDSPSPSLWSQYSGAQRLGLIGSALKDLGLSVQGRGMDANNIQNFTSQVGRQALHQQIRAAYASGDMNKVRGLLMGADPDEISHITSAAGFGAPKLQDIGGAGYSVDPLTGVPTKVISAAAKPPQTRTYQQGGQNITEQFDPTTQTWVRLGAGPKFAPRAPAKAAAPTGILPRSGPF